MRIGPQGANYQIIAASCQGIPFGEPCELISRMLLLIDERHCPTHTGVANSNIADEKVVDLIDQLLSLDPTKRPSAESALNHPYFFDLPKLEPSE